MRIDFSSLEQSPLARREKTSPLINLLPQYWKQEYPQMQREVLQQIDETAPSLSFSVSYPYQVNRSLSPSVLSKELAYLSAKKVLPSSTLKFIKANISTQLQKVEQSRVNQDKVNDKLQRNVHKKLVFDDWSMRGKTQSFVGNNKLNKKPTVVCNNKVENKNKQLHQKQKQAFKHVKPKVLLPKKQYAASKHQQDLNGVTYRPLLNYTMNSKAAKNVGRQRKRHFQLCKSNVFQILYNDASRIASKRQAQKIIEEELSKNNVERQSRVTVSTTFQERYQRSLQKIAKRKQQTQNKADFDQQTGIKYFVPNTTISKISYYTHFKISNNSINFLEEEQSYPARPSHYSKDSQKFNKSLEDLTTSVNKSFALNASLDNKESRPRKRTLLRVDQLVELYNDLIWIDEKSMTRHRLKQEQKKVLFDFLESIQNFQKERMVNKHIFMALLKQFYKRLNLYDKAILQKRLKQQKQQIQNKQQSRKRMESFTLKGTNRKRQYSFTNLDHTQACYFV